MSMVTSVAEGGPSSWAPSTGSPRDWTEIPVGPGATAASVVGIRPAGRGSRRPGTLGFGSAVVGTRSVDGCGSQPRLLGLRSAVLGFCTAGGCGGRRGHVGVGVRVGDGLVGIGARVRFVVGVVGVVAVEGVVADVGESVGSALGQGAGFVEEGGGVGAGEQRLADGGGGYGVELEGALAGSVEAGLDVDAALVEAVFGVGGGFVGVAAVAPLGNETGQSVGVSGATRRQQLGFVLGVGVVEPAGGSGQAGGLGGRRSPHW